MRRFSNALFGLLYLLFFPKENNGQTQQISFNLIPGTNGVSLGKINAITQDKFGFMWFSDQTNRCVVRYDGSFMTRYQNNPDDPNSLGGYYPECFYADSSGVVWIGFNGSGVDRFEPATGTFKHFRHDTSEDNSLSSDWVSAIHIDRYGDLWVGTNSGLDRINLKTGKFYHFRFDENDSTSLSNDHVRAIYEDREGTVWIGTGLPWVPNTEGGLNRFDRSTQTFTRYINDPNDENSLVNNKVRAILEDSKGNFWIGTAGDGLHTFDRKTGKFTRYSYDPKNPEKLSRSPVKMDWDQITFITEDADKKLWIGTVGNGINRYDPVNQKITHFGNDADGSGAFKDNSGWWAYASDDGLVWVTTEEAHLYKIDLYNNNIPHFEGDGAVSSLYVEDPTILWVGTNSGLVRKNLKNGTSKRFVHEPKNTNSLSSNHVRRVIKDHQEIFWIGTANGLNRYDVKSKTFTRFVNVPTDSASLSDNGIMSLYEDQDLNLWVGTFTGGLNLFNRNTGKFTRFQNDIADKNSIGNGTIMAILEGGKNELWLGLSLNAGVNRLDRKTGRFTHYLSGHSVNDLFKDSGRKIWVGTQTGLYSYDDSTDDFNPVSGEWAGINMNAVIISVIGDNENNLWISTLTGIYKLNKNRDHLIHFGKESGIVTRDEDRLITGSSYLGHDGKLFFCDWDGYYSFYPDKHRTVPGKSPLYFTSFWLNTRSIKPGKNGPLQQSLYDTKAIKLDHDQNVFSFSFTSVDYHNSVDKAIYYKLDNYDADWRQAQAEDKINYYKVPSGKYAFRIKAANSANGVWSEKSMNVIISPPWWTTWWAYIIYVILFVSALWIAHRYQKAKVIRSERQKSQKIELAQAKEIEKAYTELKATQSQLIQSEKMASLGELTAGIAHEIQNPLNFVNNFSEVSNELIDEMKEEMGKGNTEEVSAIADDIKQNLIKILSHGKRADSIVKGMIQHSRNSSGVKEPTDINALADEYLRLAYHGVRAKDSSFDAIMETDYDETLSAGEGGNGKINIIPEEIGRAILNLFNNAFYAVAEKMKQNIESRPDDLVGRGYEPTITVSTKKIGTPEDDPTGGGKVEITVRDNGNGIPEKIVDKIFQPFFTTKPTGQGTGLGLSLSYDIIKSHGGELSVSTTDGEGSVFVIKLPSG